MHRLIAAPESRIRLELSVLTTWRDAHGERFGSSIPRVEHLGDGFVFEGAWRASGPGWEPGGGWYRGVRYREAAARGLNDRGDLWFAGTFTADMAVGDAVELTAWAGDLSAPLSAGSIVAQAKARAETLAARCCASDALDAALALAADQFLVAGPGVVAGYPWFGEWWRDSLTSYEGLFLETARWDEGHKILVRAVGLLLDGMLPNTAGTGPAQYNSVDATLWLLHAVARHVEVTGDLDLAAAVIGPLEAVVERHGDGARHGIAVDPVDGLITQGEEGLALTWMDARIDGVPVTPRAGKSVEVNALWVNGLAVLARLAQRLGREEAPLVSALEPRARASFPGRFVHGGRVLDVVDGPGGHDETRRPNQLLAVSLPYGPLRHHPVALSVVEACRASLLVPLGLRSLSPDDPSYLGRHQGGPSQRDRAYHQGTA